MDVKPVEFFITDVGTDEVHKINGVIFKRQGRLLGACIRFYSSSFEWLTYDIKTGLCVSDYCFYPATEQGIAYLDKRIKEFDKVLTEVDEKHYGSMIKKAYDANPDVRRQVFGE